MYVDGVYYEEQGPVGRSASNLPVNSYHQFLHRYESGLSLTERSTLQSLYQHIMKSPIIQEDGVKTDNKGTAELIGKIFEYVVVNKIPLEPFTQCVRTKFKSDTTIPLWKFLLDKDLITNTRAFITFEIKQNDKYPPSILVKKPFSVNLFSLVDSRQLNKDTGMSFRVALPYLVPLKNVHNKTVDYDKNKIRGLEETDSILDPMNPTSPWTRMMMQFDFKEYPVMNPRDNTPFPSRTKNLPITNTTVVNGKVSFRLFSILDTMDDAMKSERHVWKGELEIVNGRIRPSSTDGISPSDVEYNFLTVGSPPLKYFEWPREFGNIWAQHPPILVRDIEVMNVREMKRWSERKQKNEKEMYTSPSTKAWLANHVLAKCVVSKLRYSASEI